MLGVCATRFRGIKISVVEPSISTARLSVGIVGSVTDLSDSVVWFMASTKVKLFCGVTLIEEESSFDNEV